MTTNKPDFKVEYAQPLKQTSVTFEGIVTAHKQTARSNTTLVKAVGCERPLEFPDLRGSGFNLGDEILIVVQGRVEPKKENA